MSRTHFGVPHRRSVTCLTCTWKPSWSPCSFPKVCDLFGLIIVSTAQTLTAQVNTALFLVWCLQRPCFLEGIAFPVSLSHLQAFPTTAHWGAVPTTLPLQSCPSCFDYTDWPSGFLSHVWAQAGWDSLCRRLGQKGFRPWLCLSQMERSLVWC